MKTIEIKNVGPISKLKIEVPEEGGLVVLCGRNGAGKTTALDAVQAALSGKGKLPVKDRAVKGEVSAFGANVSVGRSTRVTGELEVHSIEGPGNVADLVDPGIQAAESADARRIRAILDITKAKVDASSFYDLVGGPERFQDLVSAKACEGDDPVKMAAAIKRDLDAKALENERRAESLRSKASTWLAQNAGIDTAEEGDAIKLADDFAKAEMRRKSLLDERSANEKKSVERNVILGRLACIPGGEQFASELSEISNDLLGIERELVHRKQQLESLAKRRQEAIDALAAAEQGILMAKAEIRTIEQTEAKLKSDASSVQAKQAMYDSLQRQLDSIVFSGVTDGDIDLAICNANKAREAMERGVVIREAKSREDDAKEALRDADSYLAEAQSLRNAAKGTDSVLSELVGGMTRRLAVEGGRLVCQTSARGTTLFAELSHGERWRLALEVAIEAVGRGGVLVCPQEAWEGLDPFNREAIADQLEGTGVVMLTAEADRSETVSAKTIGE